jgi:hypothetical protein
VVFVLDLDVGLGLVFSALCKSSLAGCLVSCLLPLVKNARDHKGLDNLQPPTQDRIPNGPSNCSASDLFEAVYHWTEGVQREADKEATNPRVVRNPITPIALCLVISPVKTSDAASLILGVRLQDKKNISS